MERSVMKSDLIKLLNVVIGKVFENEKSFMDSCWRKQIEWDELLEFYMASERCRISVLLPCGETITDTVKTEDVLAWADSI